MSNYYYLVAGLPDITLEDSKLSYTISDFKEELYTQLSNKDRKLIDLFFLKFDNANILKLLHNKDSEIDIKGNYPQDKLLDYLHVIKEGGSITSKEFPEYLSTFIATYYHTISIEETSVLPEDSLAALYYEYGISCGNEFVSSWFSFNLILNNLYTALIARKYKVEMSQRIVGYSEISNALRTSGARDFGLAGEVEFFDQLVKIIEIEELLEREKKTDLLKWNWIEDAVFFNYFSIEQIFAFLLKMEMVERWLILDRERGNELFRDMIASLKNDVSIPAGFR